MWYIYTKEYYSTIKNNKILPFAVMWMEPECIMLSEICQSEKDKYMISLMWHLRNRTEHMGRGERKERETNYKRLNDRGQTES